MKIGSDCSLAPLTAIDSLTSLELHYLLCSPMQVEQLRSMHQLHRLFIYMGSVPVPALLVMPQQLQWKQLEVNISTEEDAAALANLPSLTSFSYFSIKLRHADFLLHLPHLRKLELGFTHNLSLPAAQTDRIMAALQSCTKMTDLSLWEVGEFDFTSEQLTAALKSMAHLDSLNLRDCRALNSLSFLSTGTLSATLTTLEMDCRYKKIRS